jgi:hypothetical protein
MIIGKQKSKKKRFQISLILVKLVVPIVLTLRRLRKEDCLSPGIKVSLDTIDIPVSKNEKAGLGVWLKWLSVCLTSVKP